MFSMAIFYSTALPLPNKSKLKTARKLGAFSPCQHVEFASTSIRTNLSPIRAVYTRRDKLERSASEPKPARITDRPQAFLCKRKADPYQFRIIPYGIDPVSPHVNRVL